jgi:polar amino acid transport system ATP-binding protein
LRDVLGLLRQLAGTGMTMVVVTREIAFASNVADRIALMDKGRIVEDGPADIVMIKPSDPRGARFLDQIRPFAS